MADVIGPEAESPIPSPMTKWAPIHRETSPKTVLQGPGNLNNKRREGRVEMSRRHAIGSESRASAGTMPACKTSVKQ